LAARLGLTQTRAGEIAIAVTEAATNLEKHAKGGEILLSTHVGDHSRRLELLAIDRGPGMDVDKCLQDGYSSTASAGTGLGAIRRFASEFDAYSTEQGTVIFAAFDDTSSPKPARPPFVVGSARASKPGETACGDDWSAVFASSVQILVVDGLGHGPLAADAALEAVQAFEAGKLDSAAEAIEVIHLALRGTRGAAVAVADIDAGAGRVSYCGLGNIVGAILGGDSIHHMVSMNGTAGHDAPRINSFQYAWKTGATLVMHSDGLSTHWSLAHYRGLLNRHPGVIAGVLYRDFNRGRDDVIIVVARQT
jgi:anti-sigma regulatory factor (Ser/Thr protein kinase)